MCFFGLSPLFISLLLIFLLIFFNIQGSLYIKEVFKVINITFEWYESCVYLVDFLNSLLLIFDLANQSGVQVSPNQA